MCRYQAFVYVPCAAINFHRGFAIDVLRDPLHVPTGEQSVATTVLDQPVNGMDYADGMLLCGLTMSATAPLRLFRDDDPEHPLLFEGHEKTGTVLRL